MWIPTRPDSNNHILKKSDWGFLRAKLRRWGAQASPVDVAHEDTRTDWVLQAPDRWSLADWLTHTVPKNTITILDKTI